MKLFNWAQLSAFIAGSLMTATGGVLLSKAFAEDRTVQGAIAAQCQVRTYAPMATGGTQCMRNRVMVGSSNGTIYCADLEVYCPQDE